MKIKDLYRIIMVLLIIGGYVYLFIVMDIKTILLALGCFICMILFIGLVEFIMRNWDDFMNKKIF